MKKLDKRLFRMIKNTKGQYIAVLAIIITGIFVFTAVNNSAKNLKDAIDDYYNVTNFADIFVKGSSIPEKLKSQLVGTNDIKEAEARIVFDTKLITDDKDENVGVRVVSVDKYENKINKLFMKSGKRTLSEKDVIVIEQFAAARNINVGDEINIKINGRQNSFNVSGIATSPEYIYMMENEQTMLPNPESFGVIFLEENYLRKVYSSKGNFNEILLTVNNIENVKKTADYLEDNLDKYGVSRVIEKKDQLSNNIMEQEVSGLEMMSQSIPIVFLAFAGIMLATMLSRIVKRDRTSIGVLKALGFTEVEVLVHYLKYAASVGIIGGFLGSIFGTALSGWMTNYYLVFFSIPMLEAKVYYYRIFISVVLSLLFCIISGFLGVRGIIKINPAESMKPESPKKGKRLFVENIKFIWSHVSFSWKIVVRNIFREKRKFIFIGAAVAITCGMMVMTIWMIDIVDIMFNRHYSEFMKAQYNVSFNGFKNDNVINELSEAIRIKDMEGRIEMPFEMVNGRQSKVVNVIGLKKDTVFYGFRDIKGNMVKIPSDGILISSNLANALQIDVGDEIFLDSFIDDKDGYVKVKGIINQTLGINGYMNIDYLNEKFLDKGIINGVYINSDEDVTYKLDDMKYVSVQSQFDMKKAFEEFTTITAVSMGFMVVFSGLLGFIIVYSMTLMSINERTLEFSSLRVMGFSKKEIFNMLVRENMIMTVLGIIAGIPIGLWLVDYMGKSYTTDVYTMNEPISPKSIVISIIVTIVFIILAQLMTYAKIHKLDFMQALKNRIS
ncbi:FtsX-like permease family protein [Sedimentibacter sp.]|uniref:ABC transporter permease n=1 Tax=Sedimentibacter sp. TaxID=1960295 RepID=UPI0028ADD6E3|nr:FtsX-like permease family protein [Sedimentibacter sp.]